MKSHVLREVEGKGHTLREVIILVLFSRFYDTEVGKGKATF